MFPTDYGLRPSSKFELVNVSELFLLLTIDYILRIIFLNTPRNCRLLPPPDNPDSNRDVGDIP